MNRSAGLDLVEALQQPVLHAVDPAVQMHLLSAAPGVLQHGALRHVHYLLNHIEFAQGIGLAVFGQQVEHAPVAVAHVLDVAQPVG